MISVKAFSKVRDRVTGDRILADILYWFNIDATTLSTLDEKSYLSFPHRFNWISERFGDEVIAFVALTEAKFMITICLRNQSRHIQKVILLLATNLASLNRQLRRTRSSTSTYCQSPLKAENSFLWLTLILLSIKMVESPALSHLLQSLEDD